MALLVFNFFVALTRELSNWKLEEKFYIYVRHGKYYSLFSRGSVSKESV